MHKKAVQVLRKEREQAAVEDARTYYISQSLGVGAHENT